MDVSIPTTVFVVITAEYRGTAHSKRGKQADKNSLKEIHLDLCWKITFPFWLLPPNQREVFQTHMELYVLQKTPGVDTPEQNSRPT